MIFGRTAGAIKEINSMEEKMPYEKVDAEEIIRKLKRILEILKAKYGDPENDEKKLKNPCLD